MKRRGFLRIGLAGGALLTLGGLGLGLLPSRVVHRPRQALRALSEMEFNVLAQVAARTIGAEDVDPAAIAHGVDEAIAYWVEENRADFKQLLHLVENGVAGLLLDGRPHNFTRLDGAAQDAALYAFRDSRITARRAGYHSLHKMCGAAYYADASKWPAIGYGGPPVIPPDAVVGN